MNEEDLGRYLHRSLQGNSYLVVIDDVWDKEAWMSLKGAFPDNNNGSRVIITTRIKEVAESPDEKSHAHDLRFLSPNESWQLFCNKAFQNFNADEGSKNLGREMVQKCGGLPLAIVVLGGLLSRKKPQEWREVRNHLWQQLRVDSIEVSSLLALSFDSLPYQLKPCFLYLSLFPKDFEIKIEKLIHLLVSEGFIPQVQDHTMEEVSKYYLDELINRSLLQVVKRFWGKIEIYRVHDLLRNLAIEKAKELNFFYFYDEINDSDTSSIISSYPRQATYFITEWYLWLQKSNPHLRSLFLFGIRDEKLVTGGKKFVTMCKTFSSLRMLDIGSPIYRRETKEIGKLIHLKYLGLYMEHLDCSLISNLRRLQTLVVYSQDDVKLPTAIRRLQELRHLIGIFADRFGSVCNLTKLQTLRSLSNQSWVRIKTEKLVNLRELWLYGDLNKGVFSFDSMANLKSLRILVVRLLQFKNYFASLQPLSHCQHLVELRLQGTMEKLPQNIYEFLPNLECLSLTRSLLKDDPMPVLEKLPNLTILHLGSRFYIGKKMMCSARGFLRLEILLFEVYDGIKELQVEDGALPRLRGLSIFPNDSSLLFPERFGSIPSPDRREFSVYMPAYD